MGRISSYLHGAEASLLQSLSKANADIARATLRLSTQKKINSPSDNPSAFIALSSLQSQLNTVNATMSNVTAANAVASFASTGLGEISGLLTTIKTELLSDQSGTMTAEERLASQAVIDAAVNQINSIANSQYNGRSLLNGSSSYQVTGQDANMVSNVTVYSMTAGTTRTISGTITQAATHGEIDYLGANGAVTANATFTLNGGRGSEAITVTAGETLSQAAANINLYSNVTGVTASVSNDVMTFTSVDYGSDSAVRVNVTSGTFNTTGTGVGQDVTATINGQTITGNGNQLSINQNGLVASMTVVGGQTGSFSTMTASGGLTFALSTSLSQRSSLGISSMLAANLGAVSGNLSQIASGGAYSGLGSNAAQAMRIVDEAMGQVTAAQGVVAGFQTATVASASNMMGDLQVELASAIQQTDGFDEAEELTNLANAEVRAENSYSGLYMLFKQQKLMVDMIKSIAGLSNND